MSVNGLGAHIVPAESVCEDGNSMSTLCSYSYAVPTFNAASGTLDAKVAAVNGIGQGRTCSPSLALDNIGRSNTHTYTLPANNY